jgi:putative component of membrane protein insertase Oxa1/YidC/SpoIIIJ protein YidD
MRLSVGTETPKMTAASLALQESVSERFFMIFFTAFLVGFCRFVPASGVVGMTALSSFSRFLAVLLTSAFSLLLERCAAVSPPGAPSPPDFGGKLLALFLGGVMDNLAAGVVLASAVLGYGVHVIGEGTGAGIALAGSPPDSGARHGQTKAGIARLAEPPEIIGRAVRFVAVLVIDHDKAAGAA